MKLSENAKDYINEFEDDLGVRVYEGYSGRGMYGEETDGLVFSSISGLLELMNRATEDGEDEVVKFMLQLGRTDNLGYDTIIYQELL